MYMPAAGNLYLLLYVGMRLCEGRGLWVRGCVGAGVVARGESAHALSVAERGAEV